jgi:hypothetical protein
MDGDRGGSSQCVGNGEGGGLSTPFGIPVVWHSFGEVDVFLPYTDGRCHADPDMEQYVNFFVQLRIASSS